MRETGAGRRNGDEGCGAETESGVVVSGAAAGDACRARGRGGQSGILMTRCSCPLTWLFPVPHFRRGHPHVQATPSGCLTHQLGCPTACEDHHSHDSTH